MCADIPEHVIGLELAEEIRKHCRLKPEQSANGLRLLDSASRKRGIDAGDGGRS
uniref:hypothetical protein n=1 Tax=Halocatena pleomorpha TaxID=1785090 RepID=UPI001C89947F|nr:hypothetical protein [Halocatena pleomorpha]